MPTEIDIRPVETHAEMHAVEDVQRAAWNMIERDIVATHMMVTWTKSGGVLLGAFDGDELVGFVLGFPGLLDAEDERAAWLGTRLQHCSEMLAVRPGVQGQGIGYRLKVAQREAVLAQGIRLATWTFDPLLSRNAHLNITRLGGICRRYERNVYGELHGIYEGLPTDRLEVEWWLGGEHVEARLERSEKRMSVPTGRGWQMAGAQLLNPSTPHAEGLRAPTESPGTPDAAHLLVEVPADLNAMKAADMGLARAWQAQVRAVLEGAFKQRYAAAWFASDGESGQRRSFYVLVAEKELELHKMARRSA